MHQNINTFYHKLVILIGKKYVFIYHIGVNEPERID
jgi:hypothetical protein